MKGCACLPDFARPGEYNCIQRLYLIYIVSPLLASRHQANLYTQTTASCDLCQEFSHLSLSLATFSPPYHTMITDSQFLEDHATGPHGKVLQELFKAFLFVPDFEAKYHLGCGDIQFRAERTPPPTFSGKGKGTLQELGRFTTVIVKMDFPGHNAQPSLLKDEDMEKLRTEFGEKYVGAVDDVRFHSDSRDWTLDVMSRCSTDQDFYDKSSYSAIVRCGQQTDTVRMGLGRGDLAPVEEGLGTSLRNEYEESVKDGDKASSALQQYDGSELGSLGAESAENGIGPYAPSLAALDRAVRAGGSLARGSEFDQYLDVMVSYRPSVTAAGPTAIGLDSSAPWEHNESVHDAVSAVATATPSTSWEEQLETFRRDYETLVDKVLGTPSSFISRGENEEMASLYHRNFDPKAVSYAEIKTSLDWTDRGTRQIQLDSVASEAAESVYLRVEGEQKVLLQESSYASMPEAGEQNSAKTLEAGSCP
jgi:hypothetical protein